jgi:hypothetical protein
MSGVQARGLVGASGEFQFIKVNTKGLDKVDFHDLFEGSPQTGWRAKHPDRVTVDKTFKNKFTKRGLGRMLHEILVGHPYTGDTPYMPSEIHAATRTVNPFLAFCLFSDDTGNSKDGDARVEFNESDGQYDALISPDTTTIAEGRRGVLLSDGAGIFKTMSINYRSSSPYGEAEFVFYAQPNPSAVQTGDKGLDDFPIQAVGLAAGVDCGDGETNGQIGVRAIVGLAPTLQGVSDRKYVHQGQWNTTPEDLLVSGAKYVFPNPAGPAVSVNGYIQASAASLVQIDSTITTNASDSITAATNRIVLTNAPTDLSTTSGFDATAHERKMLRIAGSGSNNRDFTIKEVISTTEVEVYEDITSDDTNGFTGQVFISSEAYNAFDDRHQNEGRVATSADVDPPGTVIIGEAYESADTSGPHVLGRIWATPKTLTGIRIIVPKGTNKDFVPNDFVIEVLNQTALPGAPTGSERPGDNNDWQEVLVSSSPGGTYSGEATNIFDGGIYGYEYTFDAAQCYGVRLFSMQAFSSTRKVRIAAFMAFEAMTAVTLSNHALDLKVKTGDSYVPHALRNVTATQDVNDLCDSVNYAVRGYQIEAVRNRFGYLWLRGTVAGDNSDLFLDAEGGSDANTELGLPTIATQKTGITQPITKAYADAMTFIYRVNLSGNVPGGWA